MGADDRGATDPSAAIDDRSIDDLRDILLSRSRERIAALEAEVERLERRVTDEEAMASLVAPALGPAIRRAIDEHRDEVVEALYPIIGRMVARAVAESIRAFARAIDARMRTTFSLRRVVQRLRGRMIGVNAGEQALRDALACTVEEVFLIHRETGLLLRHLSSDQETSPDSELVSAMLTAIRDFVRDAFGADTDGQLEEIQYGERRILIDGTRHLYLAVVLTGIEPMTFRAEMRDCAMAIEYEYGSMLTRYDGNATPLESSDVHLRKLLTVDPDEHAPDRSDLLQRGPA